MKRNQKHLGIESYFLNLLLIAALIFAQIEPLTKTVSQNHSFSQASFFDGIESLFSERRSPNFSQKTGSQSTLQINNRPLIDSEAKAKIQKLLAHNQQISNQRPGTSPATSAWDRNLTDTEAKKQGYRDADQMNRCQQRPSMIQNLSSSRYPIQLLAFAIALGVAAQMEIGDDPMKMEAFIKETLFNPVVYLAFIGFIIAFGVSGQMLTSLQIAYDECHPRQRHQTGPTKLQKGLSPFLLPIRIGVAAAFSMIVVEVTSDPVIQQCAQLMLKNERKPLEQEHYEENCTRSAINWTGDLYEKFGGEVMAAVGSAAVFFGGLSLGAKTINSFQIIGNWSQRAGAAVTSVIGTGTLALTLKTIVLMSVFIGVVYPLVGPKIADGWWRPRYYGKRSASLIEELYQIKADLEKEIETSENIFPFESDNLNPYRIAPSWQGTGQQLESETEKLREFLDLKKRWRRTRLSKIQDLHRRWIRSFEPFAISIVIADTLYPELITDALLQSYRFDEFHLFPETRWDIPFQIFRANVMNNQICLSREGLQYAAEGRQVSPSEIEVLTDFNLKILKKIRQVVESPRVRLWIRGNQVPIQRELNIGGQNVENVLVEGLRLIDCDEPLDREGTYEELFKIRKNRVFQAMRILEWAFDQNILPEINQNELELMKKVEKHLDSFAIYTREDSDKTLEQFYDKLDEILKKQEEFTSLAWVSPFFKAKPKPLLNSEYYIYYINVRNHRLEFLNETTPLPVKNFQDIKFNSISDLMVTFAICGPEIQQSGEIYWNFKGYDFAPPRLLSSKIDPDKICWRQLRRQSGEPQVEPREGIKNLHEIRLNYKGEEFLGLIPFLAKNLDKEILANYGVTYEQQPGSILEWKVTSPTQRRLIGDREAFEIERNRVSGDVFENFWEAHVLKRLRLQLEAHWVKFHDALQNMSEIISAPDRHPRIVRDYPLYLSVQESLEQDFTFILHWIQKALKNDASREVEFKEDPSFELARRAFHNFLEKNLSIYSHSQEERTKQDNAAYQSRLLFDQARRLIEIRIAVNTLKDVTNQSLNQIDQESRDLVDDLLIVLKENAVHLRNIDIDSIFDRLHDLSHRLNDYRRGQENTEMIKNLNSLQSFFDQGTEILRNEVWEIIEFWEPYRRELVQTVF